MSQAIYYIHQDSADFDSSIPNQAIKVPVNEILDKSTLLTNLATACDFPDYFSHNWDSAWDCLTDSEVTQLTMDLTAVKRINTEDFNVFKSIIEDAYKTFGKPQLWVIVPQKNGAQTTLSH